MINHKSLAVIIPILLATSGTVNALDILNKNGSKLELYGSINPNREVSNAFLSKKSVSHDDNTNAILGLLGESNITENLMSYASVEYATDFFGPEELIHQQQTNTIRLGYAGFKYGFWGSIDYGRNYGVMNDVHKLVNRVPYIATSSLFTNNDNYMIGRNNSLLTYRNENVFGLMNGISFSLQYQDKTHNRTEVQQNNSGWGASLKYESDSGLTAIGSCFSSQRPETSDNNKNIKNRSINAYGLGLKYDNDNVYIAAFYGVAHNLVSSHSYANNLLYQPYTNKIQNIEAVAEYKFHSGFHPSLSYLDSKGQNSSFNNAPDKQNVGLEKQINISTRYEFNKNISTYMNYKIDLLNKEKLNKTHIMPTDNIIGAGIVYQF